MIIEIEMKNQDDFYFLFPFFSQLLATLNTSSTPSQQSSQLQRMQNAGHQHSQRSHSRALSAEEKARSSRIEALKSDSREFPAKPSTRKYRWRKPMFRWPSPEIPKKIPMFLNTYYRQNSRTELITLCNCNLKSANP